MLRARGEKGVENAVSFHPHNLHLAPMGNEESTSASSSSMSPAVDTSTNQFKVVVHSIDSDGDVRLVATELPAAIVGTRSHSVRLPIANVTVELSAATMTHVNKYSRNLVLDTGLNPRPGFTKARIWSDMGGQDKLDSILQELNQRFESRPSTEDQTEAFRFGSDETWVDKHIGNSSSDSSPTMPSFADFMQRQRGGMGGMGMGGIGMGEKYTVEGTDNHFQIEVVAIDSDGDPRFKVKQMPRVLIDNAAVVELLGGKIKVHIGGNKRTNFQHIGTKGVIDIDSTAEQTPGITALKIWNRYHQASRVVVW